jgi:hypothetical protein
MSEHEHESNVHCIQCSGEIIDPNELAREMIEAMTRDIGANPDLAAKLYLTLKLAAESR